MKEPHAHRYTVTEPGLLGAFVTAVLVGARPKRIQQLLKFRAVAVNDRITTNPRHAVQAGDVVTIHFGQEASPSVAMPGGLRMVFEDPHLLVVDKPPGLLTIATEKEREHTAYALLTDWVREHAGRAEERVFIVHRLDQGTSGLLVFARTEAVKRTLQDQWADVEKTYLAIVEGTPQPEADTIRSRLAENSAMHVFSSSRADEGKEAVTHYRVVQATRQFALLEVRIETGRKNQIRVHLAERGHPVVGDRKYGSRLDPAGRLALHASALAFRHPVRGERLSFVSPLPPRLKALLRT